MSVEISVVVCSHNRADLISDTINSLAKQTLPPEKYEIIVVDNASTDATGQVVRALAKEIPNLRYYFEPVPGLSGARNTGWRSAVGTFVAFIDDDGIADADWLERIINAFRQYPAAGVVGGKVSPKWSRPPAAWIKKELLEGLSLLDWADHDIFLEPGQWLCGVNIAYRKELLTRFGGFCPDLGRKGACLISSEETFLAERIVEAGFKIFYSPTIHVYHYIPPERLKKQWFYSRFYWQGRSDAIMVWERVRGRKKYLKTVWPNLKQMVSRDFLGAWLAGADIHRRVLAWRKTGFLVGAVLSFLKQR